MGNKVPHFYLGTEIDGVYLNAEQLFVRSTDLNDLLGKVTYTDALFHILQGRLPSDEERELFDLVLVAFHGGFGLLPPTTLVPRLVAGTGVSTPQALAAGYLASGPYHVGAVEQAMALYSEILEAFRDTDGDDTRTAGDLEQFAYDWVARMIEQKETIPGYGHPLLRKDPRPTHARRILCDKNVESPYFDVYDGVVRCALEKKGVPPNVDGVTGSILLKLGFRVEHGTGLFLLARTAGMLAHIVEEQTDMPYQTQKRFMILPVAMPKLFNANFKKLAKFFNRLRDNSAYQGLQKAFTGNAKKPFLKREQDDQAVIDANKQSRATKSIDETLASVPAADSGHRDKFVAASQKLPVDHDMTEEMGNDEGFELEDHCSPELLAGAAFFLSATLDRINGSKQTPAASTDVDASQLKAENLLNSALKMIQEASSLVPNDEGNGD